MPKGIDVLEKRGVANPAILDAMRKVPREKFYSNDGKVDTAHSSRMDGITITPPEVVAQMIEALDVSPNDNVLQVGTGTGYTAAVISRLVTSVFSVERDEKLAKRAKKNLAEQGFKNVQVLSGRTLKQYAANAPYDGILVSASMLSVPQRLAKRLAVGGKLVAPIGRGRDQRLVRVVRKDERVFDEQVVSDLRVMPLLGDILVEMGIVDRDEVEMAALEADVKGSRLGEILLDGHYVEESDIYAALAQQYGRTLLSTKEVLDQIDMKVLQSIPRAFMIHHRLIAMNKRHGILNVATSDPQMNDDELAQALGLQAINVALITPTDFELVWSSLDGTGAEAPTSKQQSADAAADADEEMVKFSADTIAFFESMLADAIELRASDVHFERHEQDVRVRFRIDGALRTREDYDLTPQQLAGVVHLVKVSARMDPGVRRIPQAGHFQRRIDDDVIDLRAHTQPSLFGETVVLRVLAQDAKVRDIEDLGFAEEMADEFREVLEQRSGVVLLVGPTGAGKSTTLYAALQWISQDDTRKAVTVEDPISYALPGVLQFRIDAQNGFGVSDAIRAATRDDVDVIMVGDISDGETVDAVMQASQAGQLVKGAVFGREAVDGIQRLFDLGVNPNTVASELQGVVAQRLAGRICTECRREVDPDEELLESIFPDGTPDGFVAYGGEGCEACDGHGTDGRIALTEFLRVDSGLRRIVAQGPTYEELRSAAADAGLVTMRETALQLVLDGVIPLEELRWVQSH